MYIWTGIDMDDQLAGIREQVRQLEREQGVTNSNLTLPFHISLKMFFEMDEARAAEVADTLEAYYRKLRPSRSPFPALNITQRSRGSA